MDMAPENRADALALIDYRKEIVGISQCHPVQPTAAHRHGVVVNANQHMPGALIGQCRAKTQELGRIELAAVVTLTETVQQNDRPVLKLGRAADLKRRAAQNVVHDVRRVVISRYAVNRNTVWLERLPKALVPGSRFILDQVAGGDHCVGSQLTVHGISNNRLERIVGIETAHAAIRMGVQMRIGNMQES